MNRPPLRPAILLAAISAVVASAVWAEEPPAAPDPALAAAAAKLKLPGVALNLKERSVDVDSSLCLAAGMLELVACTKDTKEHESIVVVQAKAVHIHTALLLLGAQAGSPAMRKPLEGGGWVDIPPSGAPVDVSLVITDAEGKAVERPISAFIKRTGSQDGVEPDPKESKEFPTSTFVFAGSHLVGEGPGPRTYLADSSGSVISLSTFGDEVLCLPGVYGHENGALIWELDSTKVPDVGTKVILRLRPKFAQPK